MDETKLINKSDIMKVMGVNGPLGRIVAGIAFKLMKIDKVNELYGKSMDLEGADFSESIVKAVGVTYDTGESGTAGIPSEGAFITISNHPVGSLDGMILHSVVGKKRADFKILTNFILTHCPAYKDSFIPVNPFGTASAAQENLKGLKKCLAHIDEGGGLGLFPAGEVATYQKKDKKTALKKHVIEDTIWPESMIKLIKNAGVPVIPVYFEAENSRFFHFVGKIHPMLRTIRLVSEMLNKKGKHISMRIGKPVTPEELKEYDSLKELGEYLRSRVYALESEFNNANEKYASDTKAFEPIARQQDKDQIIKDVEYLRNNGGMLFETSSYQCFLAEYGKVPSLMQELGRRREDAFRNAGEGSGKALDLDEFDEYFKHLILWDNENNEIVGAYRLGIGSEIMEKHGGLKGFITSSLFKFSDEFVNSYLPFTMELGRSFVSTEHQKDALPLMLLLRGLMFSLMRYPQVQYLLGPASISNSIPRFYQSLMEYYVMSRHCDPQMKSAALPTTPFEPDFLRVNPESLLRKKMDNIEKFDKFLMKISDGKFRLPTLVKRYIKINADVICFNVDPDFNYTLDGLILLKLSDYPEQELMMLMRDIEDEGLRENITRRILGR